LGPANREARVLPNLYGGSDWSLWHFHHGLRFESFWV